MLDLALTLLLVMSGDPGNADAKPQPSPPAKDEGSRMICKREVRTGTLAGFQRTCHTRAEWTAIALGTQDSWKQLQGVAGSTNERMGLDILSPK
jgi:hypothetical protein